MLFQRIGAEWAGDGAGIRTSVADQKIIEYAANTSNVTGVNSTVGEIDGPNGWSTSYKTAVAIILAT